MEKKIKVPTEEFCQTSHRDQNEILTDFDAGAWRFALVNFHRRARKTTLGINMLIREAWRNKNARYSFVTSTFVACKNIVWRDNNMLNRWLPPEIVLRKNESELFIEFKNGSILSLHGADNPDSLRGIDCCGVVLDEAPLIKREVWEEILRPIISQDKKRWMMMTFTPKGKASWVYEYWCRYNNDPEWSRYKLTAEESGIIPADELVKVKAELPQRVYAQEFGCDFTESSASVFKNIELCIAGELDKYRQGFTYITGVDIAKVDDFTVLTTIERETRRVVGFERFNQIDYAFQKEKILAHCRRYNSFAVIDATGVGSPIADDIARSGTTVLPFSISTTSKKELVEKLMIAIEQRLITFPKIEELINELGIFSYEVTDHGNVRFAAPEGCHDDCVISLALAVYGLKNFIYGKKERKPMPMPKEEERVNAGVGY